MDDKKSSLATQILTPVEDGNYEEFMLLIDEHFFSLLFESPESLKRSFEAVPESWLRAHPRYLMARTILSTFSNPLSLPPHRELQKFTAWAQESSEALTRDLIAIKYFQIRALNSSAQFAEAEIIADEILDMISRSKDCAGFPDVLPMTLLSLGLIKLENGKTLEAASIISEARRWIADSTSGVTDHIVTGFLAMAFALLGNYKRAAYYLELSAMESAPSNPVINGLLRGRHLAARLVSLGRLDRDSRELVTENTSYESSYGTLWWIGAHIRAKEELYWGNARKGILELQQTLVERKNLVSASKAAATILHVDLANFYIAINDSAGASHSLDKIPAETTSDAVIASHARLALNEHNPILATNIIRHHFANRPIPPALGILKLAAATQQIGPSSCHSWTHVVSDAISHHAYEWFIDIPVADREMALPGNVEIPKEIPVPYEHNNVFKLSARELEVLETMKSFDSVAETASALHISANTVRTHLKSVYKKLGVHSREEALWVILKNR